MPILSFHRPDSAGKDQANLMRRALAGTTAGSNYLSSCKIFPVVMLGRVNPKKRGAKRPFFLAVVI